MTKEEMLQEIRFPIYAPRSIQFTLLDYLPPQSPTPVGAANKKKDTKSENAIPEINYNMPSVGAWIICTIPIKGTLMTGLYKWQEKDNPEDIQHWSYLNIEATTGLSRMVEYKHSSHPKVILICDEKQKDLKIEPKKTNPNVN